MRFFLLVVVIGIASQGFSQPIRKIVLSAIIVDTDSIPIPDVAIVNTQTSRTVRTNADGFFQIEIGAEDSLLVYHIAYKKQFINERHNGRYIVIYPEIQELLQINVTNKGVQEMKNLEETVKDIKRLAPLKKITEYDMKSRQKKFIEANGSHNKGFSPFFGPSTSTSLQKVTGVVAGTREKRLKKKLTAHYHLVKRKITNEKTM